MRRGFTLIEMAMVAAIMGVLALLAAPRVATTIANARVQSAAARLAADLVAARAAARQASASRAVTFGARGYTITGLSSQSDPAAPYAVALGDEPFGVELVSVVIAGGTATRTLSFDGYGAPSATATITLRRGPAVRSVIVNAPGTVRVN